MNSSRTRQAPALLLASLALLGVVALLTGVGSATANPIQSKRAQAQAVLAQIQESDVQLEKAIEAYNYANVQLDQIDTDLHSNANHLVVAQKSLNTAQLHIADRLRALYVNGDGGGAVEILLGAQNLDDLLGRLDMVQRVGDQDAKVLGDVVQFRKEVKERRERLEDGTGAAGADRGRSREPEAVDREPARGATADARRDPERDQAAAGGRGAQAGTARGRGRGRIAAQQRSASMARASATEIAAEASRPRSTTATLRARSPPRPRPSTAASSGSRCSSSASRTSGAAPGRAASIAPASSMYVYAQVGVSLPHNAAAQYGYGSPVSSAISSPATSSSSRASATSASTSAAASSSTRRTPATSSRSRA